MPGNSPHYGRWPQHDFTSLKKLRPQSVTSRIQPGSDVIVCAEMDEQWGYVGAKSRQRWLFYAYDRLRKTVVAHVFGERTLATLERLLSLLSAFEVVVWMTGTVAKLAMRQPFVLFKGLTFQKLCLPGAFRPGDHHNKMLRPGLSVVHASP